MKTRIKERRGSVFTKRVVLLFDRKPQPFWRFSSENFLSPNHQAKVVTVTHDGHYWVEAIYMHGATAHRVVRHHWPKFDPEQAADTDPAWPAKIENSQGVYVRDLVFSSERSYASALHYWPIAAAGVGMLILWKLSFWLFAGMTAPFLYWLNLVLRGGMGNVPIAKDVLGINRPMLLTPYQLDRHVTKGLEGDVEEGALEVSA